MLKKTILTLTMCMALATAVPTYAASPAQPESESVVIVEQNVTEVITPDDAQAVNDVQKSELTRKMIQAEKAKNAAENDSFGGAITIIAMCIVLLALIILSVLFFCFGKISSAILSHKKRAAHGVTAENSEDHHETEDTVDTIAAIGVALAEHFGQNHDIEDTILTIRRMKRSYSPWNSKIYNMRQMPVQTHPTRK